MNGGMSAATPLPPPSPASPVYLDNHATTRVEPRVVAAMLPWFNEKYGNAASINHRFGWDAAAVVDESRRQIGAFLKAPAEAILFTSGGTESNNLALKGVLRAAPRNAHLIVSA